MKILLSERQYIKLILEQSLNPDNLKFGDRGEKVKILQQKLMDMKDKNGRPFLQTKSMIPTGYFGPMTKAALDRAQGNTSSQKTKPQTKSQTNQSNYIIVTRGGKKTNVPVIEVVGNAPRINQEIAFINARPEYNGVPFFIADPKDNLVFAFNEKHQLIDYSQSVAGADKQKDEVYTYAQWCRDSGLEYNDITKVCADKKQMMVADTPEKKAKITSSTPSYEILKQKGTRYAAKGIYSVSSSRYEKGYLGKENVPNLFYMKGPKGEEIGTAIHGLVRLENRIKADEKLKEYLNKEKSKGTIPQKYFDLIKKITDEDLSSGCFNVDPEFINNPEVLRIAKKKPPVFIMGEKDKNYLVQVEPSKQTEFFMTMAQGEDGQCVSPSYLETQFGVNAGDKTEIS